MEYTCAVCDTAVLPNAEGKIRLEGITEGETGMAWVWGPVPVHDPCRLHLKTPYDERVGDGRYRATWQLMSA